MALGEPEAMAEEEGAGADVSGSAGSGSGVSIQRFQPSGAGGQPGLGCQPGGGVHPAEGTAQPGGCVERLHAQEATNAPTRAVDPLRRHHVPCWIG